jgi:hypothetical protein
MQIPELGDFRSGSITAINGRCGKSHCSGVRRMQAMVGQEAPFDHGREQMKILAGLEVTAKSVERVAGAIGADIAGAEQREIAKAVQLDLPVIVGQPILAAAAFQAA